MSTAHGHHEIDSTYITETMNAAYTPSDAIGKSGESAVPTNDIAVVSEVASTVDAVRESVDAIRASSVARSEEAVAAAAAACASVYDATAVARELWRHASRKTNRSSAPMPRRAAS